METALETLLLKSTDHSLESIDRSALKLLLKEKAKIAQGRETMDRIKKKLTTQYLQHNKLCEPETIFILYTSRISSEPLSNLIVSVIKFITSLFTL